MEKLLALPAACCLVLALAYTPITDIWLGQHLDTSTDLVWLMFAYCLVYSWNAIWSQVSNGMACMKMMMALAVGTGDCEHPAFVPVCRHARVEAQASCLAPSLLCSVPRSYTPSTSTES